MPCDHCSSSCSSNPISFAVAKCPLFLICRDAPLQVVAGGSDGILQELAPAELASLRDAVVPLAAEPRSAPGTLFD